MNAKSLFVFGQEYISLVYYKNFLVVKRDVHVVTWHNQSIATTLKANTAFRVDYNNTYDWDGNTYYKIVECSSNPNAVGAYTSLNSEVFENYVNTNAII
ncbi:MAG: hypothetical protein ACI4T3_01370 [Lactobacillus sp.]